MRDEHQAAIGAQIARLRERQGWSQRALAKWMGIDQSAVSRIEAGRRRLSADELQRFAAALRVSADELLRGIPPAPSPVPASGPGRMGATRVVPARSDDLDAPAEEDHTPESSVASLGAAPTPESSAPARLRESAYALLCDDAVAPDIGVGDHFRMRAPSEDATSAAGLPRHAGLPDEIVAVAGDWFRLRGLAAVGEPAPPWSTGHSALGKEERVAHTSSSLHAGTPAGDVLYDRVARFWRSELHVDPDDGPLPDPVPLLEDGYGAQVIVARVAPAAADRPVAAAFAAGGVPFIFVNAARPVVLQRFALVHAFAHLVLGHGDVVDRRIEWNRNVPPEAAANDFAEEFLAPARAVRRWYERRSVPRGVRFEDLLDLGNAFGISAWAALYRSRAAGRLQGKQFHVLRGELERHEWELLPRQAFLGGLRDTLAHLTPAEALPPGAYGGPAVLRVPAAMRAWALAALGSGSLSLEGAAAALRLQPGALAGQLERLGLE